MTDYNKKKLVLATVAYWVLLTYIVAALVWWFISLEKQNAEMTELRIAQLEETRRYHANEALYQEQLSAIQDANRRNSWKYIGEGSTFLLLILVGAGFVYRSVRRQILLQRQQQNFMMAITHELKTPIAVARLNLETLQKHQLDAEKQQKILRMTLEETTRLNDLTNNILVSSQLEGAGYRTSKEELDFSDLVKDRLQDFQNRYPERQFNITIQPEIELKGDPLLLQMMINNLLENALKYSPKSTAVSCHLAKKENVIELDISDAGEGIPDNEKEKVFEKFYRIGNELTRTAHGTGLGLYLCKKIAKDHGAEIRIKDNNPQGSRFIITFQR